MSKAVLVLGHLFNRGDFLSLESKKRAIKACEIFYRAGASIIMTSGWEYRGLGTKPIGYAVAEFLRDSMLFDPRKICLDVNARDTVGDILFARKVLVDEYGMESLYVVTSSYHLTRVRRIGSCIMPANVKVNYAGVAAGSANKNRVHELNSTRTFLEMFGACSHHSTDELLAKLERAHPLYNGKAGWEKLLIRPATDLFNSMRVF